MSSHGLSYNEVMDDFERNGRDVDIEEARSPSPEGSTYQQIIQTGIIQYSLSTSPGNISKMQHGEFVQPFFSGLMKQLNNPRSSLLSPSNTTSLDKEPLHSSHIESFPKLPPPSINTFESPQSPSSYLRHVMPRLSSQSPASIGNVQNEPLAGYRESVQFQPSTSNKTFESNLPSTRRTPPNGSCKESFCNLSTSFKISSGQKKRPILKASGEKLCRFCQQNGESHQVYKSHNLKNELGEVQCPILHNYVCPNCQATGKKAHTIKYCPRQTSKEAFSISAVQCLKMANGKMRAQYF